MADESGHEQQAADAFDAEIDRASTTGLTAILIQAYRADDVPPDVRRRVRAIVGPPAPAPKPTRTPRWSPARVAALVLGVLFLEHALGNLLLGRWVADLIHGHYEEHTYTEAAIALMGVAALLLTAVARPSPNKSLMNVATAVGAPVGIAFGIHGIPELWNAPLGGTLHAGEGLAAAALLIIQWRYAKRPPPEGRS
jgi:hypothetical protein